MAENRQRQAGYAKGVPMGGVLDAAGAPANGGQRAALCGDSSKRIRL